MPGCSSLARTRASLRRRRSRLALASAFGNLDRHLAPELVVHGEEDRSHAAAADLLDDDVAAGLEFRPAAERAQPGDGRVRQPVR